MHANIGLDYKRHFICFPGTKEPLYNGQVSTPVNEDLSAIERFYHNNDNLTPYMVQSVIHVHSK